MPCFLPYEVSPLKRRCFLFASGETGVHCLPDRIQQRRVGFAPFPTVRDKRIDAHVRAKKRFIPHGGKRIPAVRDLHMEPVPAQGKPAPRIAERRDSADRLDRVPARD